MLAQDILEYLEKAQYEGVIFTPKVFYKFFAFFLVCFRKKL